MKILKKDLVKTGLIYALIVAGINYFGFLVVASNEIMVKSDEAFEFWLVYMQEHYVMINMLSAAAFIIPTIMCVWYFSFCKEENVPARIINMPVVYSLIGSLGWILSLVLELIILLVVRITNGKNMHTVGMNSFLNIVQCCIFITTLSFMCLNTIHRVHVLPMLFPNGNLSSYKGSRRISTTAVIAVFFFSTCIFPLFYAVSTLRSYSIQYEFKIAGAFYIMLIGVCILGFVLLIALGAYFASPLGKLEKATKLIKQGIYDKKTGVISNDEFGVLADSFDDMSHSIDEKNKRIASIQNSIIRGMAVMVESRDNSTGGHINRTSECVKVFVGKMKEDGNFDITDEFEKSVIKAAPMHDLGKIAVDDAILRKPGRFTDDEFNVMKKHAEEGAKIVAEVLKESDDEEFKKIAENVAHYHHEKWDGNGYPTGISKTDIPYEARIMALADVFDALVSKRCYKESMGYDKAFAIIEESLGTHFDPELGRFFISCRKELEDLYDELPE